MKTLSLVLLLVASMAFVLPGCSDNSAPVSASTAPVASPGEMNTLGGVVQRDISEFLNAQVNWTGWSGPPPDYPLFYVADYAGMFNKKYALGRPTTFDGIITEKALSDGTAEVRIMVRAHDILIYVRRGPAGATLFGARVGDVLAGAAPTLGEAKLEITFINSAPGAPIPDLFSMMITGVSFESSAFGPLKAAAGLGPDGTPGHAWVNQIGLFTKEHGQLSVDGFATENVRLQAVGH